MKGTKGSFEIPLERRELLLANVGWVADHRVEPAALAERLAVAVEEHLGEFEIPVEEALRCGPLAGDLEDGRVLRHLEAAARQVRTQSLPQRLVHAQPEVSRRGDVGE